MIRISQKRLEEIDRCLSDRDKAVIRSIQECRYLTSGQVHRLHFSEHATGAAGLRAAQRGLMKLGSYKLIETLDRRIGGVRSGSGSLVWSLTEAGIKLPCLNGKGCESRKRFFEPSPAYLTHTVAVAETYVRLTEICADRGMELVRTELAPSCWRGYRDGDGKTAVLKPDLFAVTKSGEYRDSYFIEVDLGTESPIVVLEKCRRYALYYRSGAEQKQSGVFPLAVWIMPSAARKENLKRHIAESRDLQSKNIFLVITPDEFEALLRGGMPNTGGK
jgi:hypothetical protein